MHYEPSFTRQRPLRLAPLEIDLEVHIPRHIEMISNFHRDVSNTPPMRWEYISHVRTP